MAEALTGTTPEALENVTVNEHGDVAGTGNCPISVHAGPDGGRGHLAAAEMGNHRVSLDGHRGLAALAWTTRPTGLGRRQPAGQAAVFADVAALARGRCRGRR